VANKIYPQPNLYGIRDLSGRTAPIPQDRIPAHLAHIFLLTQWGDTMPQLVSANSAGLTYGINSFDPRYPWANHQTAVANVFLKNGCPILAQRIRLPGAETAMIRLSMETIPTILPIYARNLDGSIVYQSNAVGQPTPVQTGTTNGTRIVWWLGADMYPMEQQGFGLGQPISNYRLGSALSSTGIQLGSLTRIDQISGGIPVTTAITPASTLTPIWDIPAANFGAYGNTFGITLKPLSTQDTGSNALLIEQLRTMLYNVQIVQAPLNGGGAIVIPSNLGESAIVGAMVQNLVNPQSTAQLSLQTELVNQYQSIDDPALVPVQSAFAQSKIYQPYFDAVLKQLITGYTYQGVTIAGEASWDNAASYYGRDSVAAFSDPLNFKLLNAFTGVDQHGVPYWSIDTVDSTMFGGVSFNLPLYAAGGDDGLISNSGAYDNLANLEQFDNAVMEQLTYYGALEAPVRDIARYPLSGLWDTGFSLETKRAMLIPLTVRKDIIAVLSTFSLADYVGPPVATVVHPLGAPTVTFLDDTNMDGRISGLEYRNPSTVRLSIPTGAVVGDTWNSSILGGGGSATGILSLVDLALGYVTVSYVLTHGSSYTVQASYVNAGGQGAIGAGTISIGLNAPVVSYPTDITRSGTIVSATYINPMPVAVTLPVGVVAGDTWALTITETPLGGLAVVSNQSGAVTLTDVANGYIRKFMDITTLADIGKVVASATYTHDSVTSDPGSASINIDATISAPVVSFPADINHDGVIEITELVTPTPVEFTVPVEAVAGDIWTATAAGYGSTQGTLTPAQIAAGVVDTGFAVQPNLATVDYVLPPTSTMPTITFPGDPTHSGSVTVGPDTLPLLVRASLPSGTLIGDMWYVRAAGFAPATGVVNNVDLANGYITAYFIVTANLPPAPPLSPPPLSNISCAGATGQVTIEGAGTVGGIPYINSSIYVNGNHIQDANLGSYGQQYTALAPYVTVNVQPDVGIRYNIVNASSNNVRIEVKPAAGLSGYIGLLNTWSQVGNPTAIFYDLNDQVIPVNSPPNESNGYINFSRMTVCLIPN
jgi:hypothetical protein